MKYIHADSGKMFNSLVNARKYAIKYIMDERKNGWMMEGEYDRSRTYIDELVKYGPGVKPVTYGYVGYVRNGNKITVYWRPKKKEDSRILNKDGTTAGKITAAQWKKL